MKTCKYIALKLTETKQEDKLLSTVTQGWFHKHVYTY